MNVLGLIFAGIAAAACGAAAAAEPFGARLPMADNSAVFVAMGDEFAAAEATLAKAGLHVASGPVQLKLNKRYLERENLKAVFTYAFQGEARTATSYVPVHADIYAARQGGIPKVTGLVVRIRPEGAIPEKSEDRTKELARLEAAYGKPERCSYEDAATADFRCTWLQPLDAKFEWMMDVVLREGEWSYKVQPRPLP